MKDTWTIPGAKVTMEGSAAGIAELLKILVALYVRKENKK